ncbi:hypothetical protein ACJIZ3_025849 [Penstemon smallii]|uniref:RING-type E3 ubiquitin transferase n=1 Tax=Penstemon smallii TaxID=265156 RepID=A0ABD3TY91_9LAMI
MRKLPSSAVAMAEFNIHLSPPSTTSTLAAPPPSPSMKCDARKCPWSPYTNSNDFKVNTALILVVLFCTLICALAFNSAIRYIIRMRCRRRQLGQNAEDQKSELEEAEFPTLIYSEEELKNLKGADAECIICLSDFEIGERIRILEKCNHGFHLMCIQKWLVSHSSCPTCRTNYTVQSDAVSAP